MGVKRRLVAFGLMVVLMVAYVFWQYVATPYRHGYCRAANDDFYRTYNFPEGEAYCPASFAPTNGVVAVYRGFPQADWVKGTVLSDFYKCLWERGFRRYCASHGHRFQWTDKQPAEVGRPYIQRIAPPEDDNGLDPGMLEIDAELHGTNGRSVPAR